MPRDWRFWVIGSLMVAALATCAVVAALDIERDLLVRAQRALAAAGIPYYGLEIDGRDAVLRGPVASPAEGDRVRGVVASVRGIRTVHDALIVEAFPEPDRERTRPPGVPPALRVQRLGDRLFVSGRLPADGTADEIRRRLDGIGVEVASLQLAASDDVAAAVWRPHFADLLSLVLELDGTGRLTIQGRTALLSGFVRDVEARRRIVQRARSLPDLVWRFDLFSSGGALELPGDDD